MATATKEKAATTRAERVKRYVVLDAVEAFLSSLQTKVRYDQDLIAHHCPDVLTDVVPESLLSFQEEHLASDTEPNAARLLNELWPTDEDTETAEHRLAMARSYLLTARMYAALTADPEALAGWRDHYYARADRAFAGILDSTAVGA